MKFGSKELYGLKVVVEMARWYDKGAVSLAKISQVRKLPLPYLEQIISFLRKAGLVKSIRGVKGGYRLTKAPEEISVADVLRALESKSLLSFCPEGADFCLLAEGICCCPEGEECEVKRFLEKVHTIFFSVLEKISIAEISKKMPPACP